MSNTSPERTEGAISILLCTIACRDRLLEHALDIARDAAFDGVEIWGREPHMPDEFDENRMRAARKLLDAKGVLPYVLGSYLRFGTTRLDGDVELNDVLHIARWLRTPLVRVWASDVGSRDATPELWQRTVSEAQEACERAAKLDMTLVVEMHDATLADTAASARRLIEEVGRDNFRLNFQVASHDDGQSPEQRLEAVLPWVSHVHAQNYAAVPAHESEPVRRVALSAGFANYPVLIGMLKDAGYQGSIAVEFAHDEAGDKQAALVEDLRFLRSICR